MKIIYAAAWILIAILALPLYAGEAAPEKPGVAVESEPDPLKERVREILRELEAEKAKEKPPAPPEREKTPLLGYPMRNNRKGFRVYLGGDLELEHFWYQTNEGNTDFVTGKESSEWEGTFRIKSFRLYPEVRFGSLATMEGELDFRPRGIYSTEGHTHTVDVSTGKVLETTSESSDEYETGAGIEEMHVTFHLPAKHKLKIGLDERWIRPKRRTETYPMLGSAFWRHETFQVLFKGKDISNAGIYYALGWGTGLTFNTRNLGKRTSPKTFGATAAEDRIFRDDDYGNEKKWEYTAGLGFRYGLDPENDKKKKREYVDVRVYYFNSRMLYDEIAGMQDYITGYLGTLRHQHRLGGRFEYFRRGFYAEAEYILARDGRLDRTGTSFALGYKFRMGKKGKGYAYGEHKTPVLKSIFPLIRFDTMNNDLRGLVLDSSSGSLVKYRKNVNDPVMWDRTQLTLAVITELTDYVELRFEYSIRNEETGGFTSAEKNVDNDEFLVYFGFKF